MDTFYNQIRLSVVENDSGDDQLLSEALDQAEKQLGGGTSHADILIFTPYTNCRARRFGVHQRTLTTLLY